MRISDWSSDVCSSDLAELSSIKMRSFFSSASARGVPVTLVLSRKSFDSLAEVERRFLRDTAVRNDFRLALGEAERGRFGNPRIADLEIGRASCRERVCEYV